LNRQTSYLAGLIGSGIGPSLTPPMHEREGARHGLRYVYRSIDITKLGLGPQSVTDLVRAAGVLGFDGLNITHPCKQLVLQALDGVSAEAEAVGAVNTVVYDDGRAIGHNTDVTGFEHSFRRGLPGVAMRTVVQVGAGGAGAAVANALIELGAERLLISDVDEARARRLTDTLRAAAPSTMVELCESPRLAEVVTAADGIINATPVGMAEHPGSAVPTHSLQAGQWVADVVYRPIETELVRSARDRGCRVLTGAGMAVHQAVDAFTLITGRPADADAMRADFENLVAQEVATGTPAGGKDA